MPTGRPTDYNEQVLTDSWHYITEFSNDEEKQVVTGEGESFTKYETKLVVKLPTIEGLASYLEVSRSTVYLWQKEHKEFSDIIETLLQKQAQVLINKGLSGDYNSTIAKVLLTKHGYSDKQEIEQKTTLNDERIDESKLTDEELRVLVEIQRKGRASS
jgi:hypothetical protein